MMIMFGNNKKIDSMQIKITRSAVFCYVGLIDRVDRGLWEENNWNVNGQAHMSLADSHFEKYENIFDVDLRVL